MSTNLVKIDQRADSAQVKDEAVKEAGGEIEEVDLLQEGKVEDANDRFEIVGNDIPSSDKDILIWHRVQYED